MPYTVPKLDDYSPEALDRAAAALEAALVEELNAVATEQQWKALRDRWLARKNGILTQINDLWLKAAPPSSKKTVGQIVNRLNDSVSNHVALANPAPGLRDVPEMSESARKVFGFERQIEERALELRRQQIERGRLDVTLPGIRRPLGAEHPVIRTMNEIVGIFRAMGYSVAEGPEVESDYFNFEALNFPPEHPARDTQDTLFVAGQEHRPQRDRLMLRTHTSPVQVRAMMQQPPPLRIVCPGKVHRRDTPDATHTPVFHQVEGLAVDTNITFRDLKGTLDHAMKALFGANVKTRFQPSFFPFTEPSAEVAISCPFCGGRGCRVCKQSGWIELLGAGMVDPNVFAAVREYGYDPAKITGFAFGMGVDRVAAMRWDINDIQLFFQGDVRFLEQFA